MNDLQHDERAILVEAVKDLRFGSKAACAGPLQVCRRERAIELLRRGLRRNRVEVWGLRIARANNNSSAREEARQRYRGLPEDRREHGGRRKRCNSGVMLIELIPAPDCEDSRLVSASAVAASSSTSRSSALYTS